MLVSQLKFLFSVFFSRRKKINLDYLGGIAPAIQILRSASKQFTTKTQVPFRPCHENATVFDPGTISGCGNSYSVP